MALPPPKTKHKIIAAITLFLLLPAGCAFIIGGLKPDPAISNKIDAIVCAQQKVREQLKAPSTAKFPYQSEMIIETKDNLKYKIGSYVDAQNGFGAMIRTHFICDVQLNPEAKTCVTECSID